MNNRALEERVEASCELTSDSHFEPKRDVIFINNVLESAGAVVHDKADVIISAEYIECTENVRMTRQVDSVEYDLLFELFLHVSLFIVGFDHLESISGVRLIFFNHLKDTCECSFVNELHHFVALGFFHLSGVFGHRFLITLIYIIIFLHSSTGATLLLLLPSGLLKNT